MVTLRIACRSRVRTAPCQKLSGELCSSESLDLRSRAQALSCSRARALAVARVLRPSDFLTFSFAGGRAAVPWQFVISALPASCFGRMCEAPDAHGVIPARPVVMLFWKERIGGGGSRASVYRAGTPERTPRPSAPSPTVTVRSNASV